MMPTTETVLSQGNPTDALVFMVPVQHATSPTTHVLAGHSSSDSCAACGACVAPPWHVLCAGSKSQNTQAGRPSSSSRGFFDPLPTSAPPSMSSGAQDALKGPSNRPQSLEDLPKHSTSSDDNTAASPPKVRLSFMCTMFAGSSKVQLQSVASMLVCTTQAAFV